MNMNKNANTVMDKKCLCGREDTINVLFRCVYEDKGIDESGMIGINGKPLDRKTEIPSKFVYMHICRKCLKKHREKLLKFIKNRNTGVEYLDYSTREPIQF